MSAKPPLETQALLKASRPLKWCTVRIAVALMVNLYLLFKPALWGGVEREIREALLDGSLATIAIVSLIQSFRGAPVHRKIGLCMLMVLPIVTLLSIIDRYR